MNGDGAAPFWTDAPGAKEYLARAEARLDRARRAVDAVLAAAAPRTIVNTLQPYDDALIELDSLSPATLLENVHPDRELRETAETVTQKAAAFATQLSLDRGVYDALAALDLGGVDPPTRHYVEKTLREFRLAGVDRDAATRERIRKLNDELVEIGQEFARNIRSDQRRVTVTDAAELAGLPDDFIARHPPGPDGAITITIDSPDATPVFLYAASEDLRRRLYFEYNNRAHPANLPVLERMLAKRHELAALLGFRHWADYVTADKMVGDADKARAFIDRVVEVAGVRAASDYASLLRRKRQDAAEATRVLAWESGYYAEQVRKSEHDFDARELRPYFPYRRVVEGVIGLAARLYGVSFRRAEAPVWHPAVECWEMVEDGRVTGRFYLDMHPRPDKYSHAALFDIRTGVQGRQLPEAALVCNFPGGEPGDPGYMEHGDVRTLLHEFGHLLHLLFAGKHRWVGIGGIRPEADFTEVPSQLFEEWSWSPEVLATFGRHDKTGEVIPAEMVRRLKRASEFGKGLQARRQMVFAGLSLAAHDRPPAEAALDDLYRLLTERYQPFPFVEGTHFPCGFGHLDGYSAIYYSYMWSLVIAKDCLGRFDAANLLDPEVPRLYRDAVLAAGGSVPAAQMVERFLGRPFRFEAFERWLGEEG